MELRGTNLLDLFSVSVVMTRGLAVLVILQVISGIPAALVLAKRQSLPDESSISPDYSVVIAMVSYILLAIILLIFSNRLGRLLTGGLDNTTIQVDESNIRVLQVAVFSLLGAYVLVYSIATLVEMLFIATVPVPRDEAQGLFRMVKRSIPLDQVVEELAKTALGVWLLFGGKRIIVLIRTTWSNTLSVDSPE
ncbi:MAG TPA: hypothetical protein VGL29_24430 [Blastocatellia bacterium]|jgi:hypothetical protein